MKNLKYTLLVALFLALGAAWLRCAVRTRVVSGYGGIDGAVIDIRPARSGDLWRVDIYCGEVRTRMSNGQLDRTEVIYLLVDGKAIEELRELMKSQEIVHIRGNLNAGLFTPVSIQKLGKRLKVEDEQ